MPPDRGADGRIDPLAAMVNEGYGPTAEERAERLVIERLTNA